MSSFMLIRRLVLWTLSALVFIIGVCVLVIVLHITYSVEWVDVNADEFRVVSERLADCDNQQRTIYVEFDNAKSWNLCRMKIYSQTEDVARLVGRLNVVKKDKYGKEKSLVYDATQALVENGRIAFTIDSSFAPAEEGETLCVEVVFKKHGQGNQASPIRITYKAQKIWYVRMAGW